MISGTVGKIIGPSSTGTASGESTRASMEDFRVMEFADASTSGADWSSTADGLSLGLSGMSAMRRLEGEPDLPVTLLVLILLILVCREFPTVVAARFSKRC